MKPLGEKLNIKMKNHTLIQRGLAQFQCKCANKILNKAVVTEPKQKKHHKIKRKCFFPPHLLHFNILRRTK